MDESVGNAKRVLRREIRRQRAELDDRPQRSAQIWMRVMVLLEQRRALRRDAPMRVFAFRGVGTEPETDPWIAALLAQGITVCLPRCEGEVMVAVDIDARTTYATSSFGIPEPAGPAIDPQTIDMVIVPGIAFTARGHRLGQGGGYYDRYLPTLRDDCATIAVCFEPQVVPSVPGEAHDQCVHYVVTDEHTRQA